ncbi:hypothetical protein KV564_26355 [Paenibacillus chitinolyticus]|nr:hypothetical protein [Paenibacillus chitinolyticus]
MAPGPTRARYQGYVGIPFIFIREIDPKENVQESPRMFLIRLSNGEEIPAFKDEIELDHKSELNHF